MKVIYQCRRTVAAAARAFKRRGKKGGTRGKNVNYEKQQDGRGK